MFKLLMVAQLKYIVQWMGHGKEIKMAGYYLIQKPVV